MSALRVTRAQVLAFRLASQHLARPLRAGSAVEAAACVLQDTPPGSAELALAARVKSLAAGDLQRLLEEDRTVVRAWAMRGAPMVVPAADLGVYTVGAFPADDASWRTALAGYARTLKETGHEAHDDHRLPLKETLNVLRAKPHTKADLSTALHDRLPPELRPWCRPCGVDHVAESLLRSTGLSGEVVFGPQRDGKPTLVRAADWLRRGPAPPDPDTARAELLRRFLRLHGPTTAELFAGWAGLSPADGRRSWRAIEDQTVEVLVEGTARRLHTADVDDFASPPTATGARLLPASDPLLQARDREVLIPDAAVAKRLWRPLGSPGLVLVDGRPTAIWRARKSGRTFGVLLEPLSRLTAAARRSVEAEAARLAPLRGCTEAAVEVAG